MESSEAAEQLASCSEPQSDHNYDVFLSFRGPDTRVNFSDHLYRELAREGYAVFRDEEEIPHGHRLWPELQKAIHESKICIVVFSQTYASSKWCLNELLTIMKRQEEDGHLVVLVFYHVEPSDVRNQTGSFGEHFVQHQQNFPMETVDAWRKALNSAGSIRGEPIKVEENRYESDVIQQIVKIVGNQVRLKIRNVCPKFVGREFEMVLINSWVQYGTPHVGIAAICGIGGIGKTTIAGKVYNMNYHRFEASCFLEDVREMSKQHQGLVHLQTKLLQDLTKTTVNSVLGESEVRDKIKRVVRRKKVLLILDDVDDMDQYDKLIGKKEWFSPGSKIIITTKSKDIPRAHERDKMFEIRPLRIGESLELLSWHAFGQDHPKQGYDKCSRDLVHYCGGLPKALEVLGSSLSDTTTDVWESELRKLEGNPNRTIQDVLRIGYDSLPDHHDKKLFLDLACFFNGFHQKYALEILEGCGFQFTAGIRNLMNRCLISVNLEGKLMMHQLIRDMSRDLSREESLDNPGKRRRV